MNVTPFKLFLTFVTGFAIGFISSQLITKINDETNNNGYSFSILSLPLKHYNNKYYEIREVNETNENSLSVLEQDHKNKNINGNENYNKFILEQQQQQQQQQQQLELKQQKQLEYKQPLINRTLADRLYKNVRVLCWIVTGPQNHRNRAQHVKSTWGSRCNKLLFMSSVDDEYLGTIRLNVSEGRGNLWHKTREAAKYIYDHHLNEAEWFLKADDDTYVILENLRAFLYPFSSDAPVYFGSKFKSHFQQGYMSGGAGYVMSKEALRRFATKAYANRTICRQSPGGAEDLEMGICLHNVGVVAGDSRDQLKRARFLPSSLNSHIVRTKNDHWYWRYTFYNTLKKADCCSDYAISFHYVKPDYMHVLDYLIYKLKLFGITTMQERMPAKQNTSALLEKWRYDISDNPL